MPKKTLKLYGEISWWDSNTAAEFSRRFTEALKDATSIDLHIHSPGGEVFEGNLIYNIIKNSPIPVDIYVDGMAASMASIIMLAGRNIYMSANAFVMIHAPYGVVLGNASDMKKGETLLSEMEKIMMSVYQAKTGKTDEELKAWFVGDNWFSAEMAKEEGLIDGVVDIIADHSSDVDADLSEMDAKAMYGRYVSLNTGKKNEISKTQNKALMDKKGIIAKFGLTTVTEDSSEEDIQNAMSSRLEQQQAENASLKAKSDTEKAERIKSVLDSAIVAGKITESQRAEFQGVGEKAGEQTLDTVLASIKVATPLSSIGVHNPSGSVNAGREAWTWDDWQAKDSKGLEKLPTEKIEALYQAKYGTSVPQ